jgi:hypothetical protein
LKEVQLFVKNLDLEGCFLASDHITNFLWAGNAIFYRGVAGDLPGDKKNMLKTLRKALDFIESTELEVKDSNQLLKEGSITSL